MTNEPIILKLTPEDVLRLTRTLLDEDKEEATSVSEAVPQTSTRSGYKRSSNSFF